MFFFSLLLEVPQSDFWCWNFVLESYYAFLFGEEVVCHLKSEDYSEIYDLHEVSTSDCNFFLD